MHVTSTTLFMILGSFLPLVAYSWTLCQSCNRLLPLCRKRLIKMIILRTLRSLQKCCYWSWFLTLTQFVVVKYNPNNYSYFINNSWVLKICRVTFRHLSWREKYCLKIRCTALCQWPCVFSLWSEADQKLPLPAFSSNWAVLGWLAQTCMSNF